MDYSDTANTLAQRILALIPAHPKIMDMIEPFDLYKVEGFDCSDLEPTLFQASWALSRAKLLYENKK